MVFDKVKRGTKYWKKLVIWNKSEKSVVFRVKRGVYPHFEVKLVPEFAIAPNLGVKVYVSFLARELEPLPMLIDDELTVLTEDNKKTVQLIVNLAS